MGVRNFLVKVNSDTAYRTKFIQDPVGVLKKEGIKLSAKDQKELVLVVKRLSTNLPNLGKLPPGYEVVVAALAGEGGPTEPVATPMLI